MEKKSKTDMPETQKQLSEQAMSQELQSVSKYLSEVKFRKQFLGVDEADLWRKIEKLCELYEYAIDAERARADKAQQQLNTLYARARELKNSRNSPEAASREVGHG